MPVVSPAGGPHVWFARGRSRGESATRVQPASQRDGGTVPHNLLTVAIRRNSTSLQDSLPENTMGIASGTPLERGRVAYVFYGQTEQFTPLVRGRFLGHFMAHELGHLLLPQYSHSARG